MRSRFTAWACLLSAIAVLSMFADSQAAQDASSGTTRFRKARIINALTPPKPALYIPPLRPIVTSAQPPRPAVAPSNPMPPMAESPASPSIKPAAPGPAAIVNAPSAIVNTPAPEPQGTISIEVKDGLISARIEDAALGRIMEAIGKKAKFEVKLYGEIPEGPISTEFSSMDIERAVIRIMRLAGQKDYFFHYDTKGAITLLETFGASAIKPQPTTPVKKSTPSAPRATVKRRPTLPQPNSYEPALADEPVYDDQFEDDIQDDPYQGDPAYIPPARRR